MNTGTVWNCNFTEPLPRSTRITRTQECHSLGFVCLAPSFLKGAWYLQYTCHIGSTKPDPVHRKYQSWHIHTHTRSNLTYENFFFLCPPQIDWCPLSETKKKKGQQSSEAGAKEAKQRIQDPAVPQSLTSSVLLAAPQSIPPSLLPVTWSYYSSKLLSLRLSCVPVIDKQTSPTDTRKRYNLMKEASYQSPMLRPSTQSMCSHE